MRKYGFDNGYGTTFDHGLHFLNFPVFSYGHEILNTIEVSGRMGTLTEHTGTYTDTIITNKLEFSCKKVEEYEIRVQAIRNWLNCTRKVTYTDAEDKYYAVKKVEIDEISRIYGVFGNITVIFTCEPAVYFYEGDRGISFCNEISIYNPFSESAPVFKIQGEGTCNLIVNGKSMTANVGQNLTVDTEKMIAFREDGTMINTAVKGDYVELRMRHGDNDIRISEGFNVEIIPRWREILDDRSI